MDRFTRRDALASATALGAVVLAGCVAENDEQGGTKDGPANKEERNDTDDGSMETTEPEGTVTSDDTDGENGDGGEPGADTDEQDADSEDDERNSSQGADDEDDSSRGEDTAEERDDEWQNVGDQDVLLDYSVETTNTGCTAASVGTGRGELVSQADGTATVEGSLVASTPCHEAVIEGMSYADGELTLVVGAESSLGPEEICVQCTGKISYEATISVADRVTIESVSVTSADQVSAAG